MSYKAAEQRLKAAEQRLKAALQRLIGAGLLVNRTRGAG